MNNHFSTTGYRLLICILLLLALSQPASASSQEDLEAAVGLYSNIGARRAVDAKSCGLFELAGKMRSITVEFFSLHPISLENPANSGRIARNWDRQEERHRMVACISCNAGEFPDPWKSCEEITASAEEYINSIDDLDYDSL